MSGLVLFAGSDGWASGAWDKLGADARVDLQGRISPKCAITLEAKEVRFEIKGAGEVATPFSIDCNDDFAIRVTAENGALVRAGDGPAAQLAYELAFGPFGDVEARFAGADLKGAGRVRAVSRDSFEAIEGAVRLKWQAPPRALPAGEYGEVVRITVSSESFAGRTPRRHEEASR